MDAIDEMPTLDSRTHDALMRLSSVSWGDVSGVGPACEEDGCVVLEGVVLVGEDRTDETSHRFPRRGVPRGCLAAQEVDQPGVAEELAIMENFLDIYLNDQLAMGVAWRELARRSARNNRGGELGAALERVATGIAEDVDTFREIMRLLRVRFEELEFLTMGIDGKKQLWTTLRDCAGLAARLPDTDFEELIRRAADQSRREPVPRVDMRRRHVVFSAQGVKPSLDPGVDGPQAGHDDEVHAKPFFGHPLKAVAEVGHWIAHGGEQPAPLIEVMHVERDVDVGIPAEVVPTLHNRQTRILASQQRARGPLELRRVDRMFLDRPQHSLPATAHTTQHGRRYATTRPPGRLHLIFNTRQRPCPRNDGQGL